MLDERYNKGLEDGLILSKEIHRERSPGNCKMFSEGDDCMCFLCEIDRLLSELKSNGNQSKTSN